MNGEEMDKSKVCVDPLFVFHFFQCLDQGRRQAVLIFTSHLISQMGLYNHFVDMKQ
jgi:hypothetical protein